MYKTEDLKAKMNRLETMLDQLRIKLDMATEEVRSDTEKLYLSARKQITDIRSNLDKYQDKTGDIRLDNAAGEIGNLEVLIRQKIDSLEKKV